MENLIDELKKEHLQIAVTLNKVNTFGIYSAEGQSLLLESKNSLLSHLHREDLEIYPTLEGAAHNDPQLRRTLDVFAKDMDSISKTALEFFEKYSLGGSGLEFARDFGRLFSTLQMRIGREERILYEEYLKLHNQQ